MKRGILFILLIVLTKTILAQSKRPVIKGYAYKQESVPGVAPKGAIDEKGNEVKRTTKYGGTYFLYLEYKKNQTIKPVIIWINGKAYHVKNQKIDHSLVISQQATGISPVSDTLVNKTGNQLMQIHLNGEWPTKKMLSGVKSDNIIIEYYWRGKKYTYSISEIKKLPPAVLQ